MFLHSIHEEQNIADVLFSNDFFLPFSSTHLRRQKKAEPRYYTITEVKIR